MSKVDRKPRLLEALERSLGIVTTACKEVGISRETYRIWLKEDPEFKKKVDDIYELQGDFVESQLLKKVSEGSETSILFYMKYRGKSRGYCTSVDMNVSGSLEHKIINIKFDDEDEKENE